MAFFAIPSIRYVKKDEVLARLPIGSVLVELVVFWLRCYVYLFFVRLLDHFSRNTAYYGIVRHVFGNYRTNGYHGILTYCYSGKDGCICSNPRILLEMDRARN